VDNLRSTCALSGTQGRLEDYGSDDQHMVSRIFFNLNIGGRNFEGLYVRKPDGTDE